MISATDEIQKMLQAQMNNFKKASGSRSMSSQRVDHPENESKLPKVSILIFLQKDPQRILLA